MFGHLQSEGTHSTITIMETTLMSLPQLYTQIRLPLCFLILCILYGVAIFCLQFSIAGEWRLPGTGSITTLWFPFDFLLVYMYDYPISGHLTKLCWVSHSEINYYFPECRL